MLDAEEAVKFDSQGGLVWLAGDNIVSHKARSLSELLLSRSFGDTSDQSNCLRAGEVTALGFRVYRSPWDLSLMLRTHTGWLTSS